MSPCCDDLSPPPSITIGVLPALDVVHAPARAEVFPHLVEALAHCLHVPQIAELNLAQALDEAQTGSVILNTLSQWENSSRRLTV